MPKSYQKPTEQFDKLLEDVIIRRHHELRDAEVVIDCLMVHAPRDEEGDPTGPALTHARYTAVAVIRINPVKLRAHGLGDVEILIDGDNWNEWSTERQESVIDHELCHIVLKRDEHGNCKLDPVGRPCMEMKLHDFQIGGFFEIAKRYGKDSFESGAMAQAIRTARQMEFDFEGIEDAAAIENVGL